MKFLSMLTASVMSLAVSATAFAQPELVAHRGVWKYYGGTDVAENSVSSFNRAFGHNVRGTNARMNMIEVDVRTITVDGQKRVVVFHDHFWNRGSTISGSVNNWAHRVFKMYNISRTSLYDAMSSRTFNALRLRRNGGNGETPSTGDRPLYLADFFNQTICNMPGKRLLLDVQNVETATLVADILKRQGCRNNGLRFRVLAYMKLFAGKTIPADIANSGTADTMADRVISHYGSNIKYYFQINNGELDPNCRRDNCQLRASNGRLVDLMDFVNDAMNNPATEGIALSLPGTYPGDQYNTTKIAWVETINNLYYHVRNYKDLFGIKLMSIGARPDDRIIWSATGQNGNTSNQGRTNRCMMYNYDAGGNKLKFFGPYIFNDRNEFAMRSGFDQIVVDGYLRYGEIDFDLQREVELLCGNNSWITTRYEVTDATDAVETANYQDMTGSTRYYHFMDAIKGRSDIQSYFER